MYRSVLLQSSIIVQQSEAIINALTCTKDPPIISHLTWNERRITPEPVICCHTITMIQRQLTTLEAMSMAVKETLSTLALRACGLPKPYLSPVPSNELFTDLSQGCPAIRISTLPSFVTRHSLLGSITWRASEDFWLGLLALKKHLQLPLGYLTIVMLDVNTI